MPFADACVQEVGMAGTCGKVALVVSTVWLSLACSGIIYGWLAFVTILEDVHPDWSSTKVSSRFARNYPP